MTAQLLAAFLSLRMVATDYDAAMVAVAQHNQRLVSRLSVAAGRLLTGRPGEHLPPGP